MTYFYPLLGFSIWVAVIGLSSNALISFENKKQLESAKSFIAKASEGVTATSLEKIPQINVVTETVQKPALVNKISPITTAVKPSVQKQDRQEDRDEDEDEDD